MAKYNPGDVVGPNGVVLLERLPHEKNCKNPKCLFRCPECGGTFVDIVCHITSGRRKVCLSCSDQRTYFEGERYGPANTLLVKRTPGGKDIWKCSFCGKSFAALREDIRSGHTQSCGCYRAKCSSERRTLDLSGQKFGRLTAIRIDEQKTCEKREQNNKNRQNIWLCKCECGTEEVYVPTRRLVRGQTQSCGCLQRERTAEAQQKDLSGERFGMLIALERCVICDEQGKEKKCWRCQCDCGGEAYYTTSQLTMGAKRNCGCERVTSLGEELIQEILEDYDLAFKPQWTCDSCRNPGTGRQLAFDFKLIGKAICIEFDGRQHFSQEDSIFGDYAELHKRDLIKNQWCQENGFLLIRIPYTYYGKLRKHPDLLLDWLSGETLPVLPEYESV